MLFCYETRVRYADIDQMGIVYYSRYFEFFEAARTDMLRALGMPYSEFEAAGYRLPVVESHCNYYSGAWFDELIVVECRVDKIPGARLEIHYLVTDSASGRKIAIGHTIHAFLNERGKPCRAPRRFIDLFSAIETNDRK